MAAQMAQLSTVQALGDLTKSMQNLEAYQASASSLQAVGLIGKKVEATGNTLYIGQDNTISGGAYQLAKPGHAYIQIFDASGNMVRVIDDGVKDTSKQKLHLGRKKPAGGSSFPREITHSRFRP